MKHHIDNTINLAKVFGDAADEQRFQNLFSKRNEKSGSGNVYTPPGVNVDIPPFLEKETETDFIFTRQWTPLRDLPNHSQLIIRRLERLVFEAFPCFQRMSNQCRMQERDPVGEINALMAPGSEWVDPQILSVLQWIEDNGREIARGRLDFGDAFNGYNPEIIFSASKNDSFLMVTETRETGAPDDMITLYSWAGGTDFYQNMTADAVLDIISRNMSEKSTALAQAYGVVYDIFDLKGDDQGDDASLFGSSTYPR